MKIFHVGSHQFGNRSGSCSENCGFCIAQVVGCHSENGISYSGNGISNSESCSENTPELSESSENGLFTFHSESVFPEIGVVSDSNGIRAFLPTNPSKHTWFSASLSGLMVVVACSHWVAWEGSSSPKREECLTSNCKAGFYHPPVSVELHQPALIAIL